MQVLPSPPCLALSFVDSLISALLSSYCVIAKTTIHDLLGAQILPTRYGKPKPHAIGLLKALQEELGNVIDQLHGHVDMRASPQSRSSKNEVIFVLQRSKWLVAIVHIDSLSRPPSTPTSHHNCAQYVLDFSRKT